MLFLQEKIKRNKNQGGVDYFCLERLDQAIDRSAGR